MNRVLTLAKEQLLEEIVEGFKSEFKFSIDFGQGYMVVLPLLLDVA